MDDVDANQLPEVDSLPDGFVDSSHEPLAPPTPTIELEKPLTLSDCDRHSISDSDQANGTLALVSENESQTSCKSNEPNHLTEMDGFDGSMKSVDNAQVEDVKSTTAVPASTNLDANTSIRLSGCSDVKEQVSENCQSPDRSVQRDSGTHAADSKEISSSQITEKGRKPEHPETKRKNAKRSFKSEEEFLEFSLKYQQVLAERDAAIVVRDKLESLCRELQRQNKMLMEECKRVSTEGQNLRLDLSTKFQDAIKDVSVRLEEQKEECFSQLKENEMLRTKLKQLADQYAISEQQHAQKLKQKTLEHQIAELKIKQHEEKLAQEQSKMNVYAEQVSQLLATEKSLRMQLTADGEKFQQFQDALLKSHEVFETFKQEIEKMAKSIKELKKENLFLKSKTEKSDVTLIELVEEREILKKQLEKAKNQKEKLESLCRSLQAERKQNSNGGSVPGTDPSDH